MDAFKQFMESSYEGRFKAYSGEKVRYLGEQLMGDLPKSASARLPQIDLPVSFRLAHKEEAWRGYRPCWSASRKWNGKELGESLS